MYSVIADASKTMVELLRDRLTDHESIAVERDDIVLASPATISPESSVRLSVFLYTLSKDAHQSNVPRQQVGADTYQDPPLSLTLNYLVTAYPLETDDVTTNTYEQHRLLGLAMQIFHDNGLLKGDTLQGALDDSLQVTLDTEATEDLESVWSLVGEAVLEPSATYEVGPVNIDSTIEETVDRVTDREIDVNRNG